MTLQQSRRRRRRRRRRTGRPDAGHRSGRARHQGRRRRDARVRRAAQRQMQSRGGAHDGAVPPPRHRREGSQRRPAAGLSERRGVSHERHRHRADAHPDSLSRRSLCRQGRPRHLVAHARAAASHQPALLRADPARARRVVAERHAAASGAGRELRADRARRFGADDDRSGGRRSRQRCGHRSFAAVIWWAATAAIPWFARRWAPSSKARR